jgi:hypothetical protein
MRTPILALHNPELRIVIARCGTRGIDFSTDRRLLFLLFSLS